MVGGGCQGKDAGGGGGEVVYNKENITEIYLSQVEMRMLRVMWMLVLTLNSSIIGKRNVVGNSDVKDNGMVIAVVKVYNNNNKM